MYLNIMEFSKYWSTLSTQQKLDYIDKEIYNRSDAEAHAGRGK